jgi:hypothetical protein
VLVRDQNISSHGILSQRNRGRKFSSVVVWSNQHLDMDIISSLYMDPFPTYLALQSSLGIMANLTASATVAAADVVEIQKASGF